MLVREVDERLLAMDLARLAVVGARGLDLVVEVADDRVAAVLLDARLVAPVALADAAEVGRADPRRRGTAAAAGDAASFLRDDRRMRKKTERRGNDKVVVACISSPAHHEVCLEVDSAIEQSSSLQLIPHTRKREV